MIAGSAILAELLQDQWGIELRHSSDEPGVWSATCKGLQREAEMQGEGLGGYP
jgi:hypothetical protein